MDNPPSFTISAHARNRMAARSISRRDLALVFRYARVAHVRGARIHAVGRREVAHWRRHGIDLSRLEGLQVVCSPRQRLVITVYRNHSFRGLRPRRRSRPRRSARGMSVTGPRRRPKASKGRSRSHRRPQRWRR